MWDSFIEPSEGEDTVTLNEDGSLSLSGLWTDLNLEEGGAPLLPMYLARLGNVSVAMIPENYEGKVTWTAVKDGTVECRLIAVGRLAEASFEAFRGSRKTVRAGESEALWQGNSDSPFSAELVPGTANPGNVTNFLGITSPGFSWRTAVTILLCILGALLCVPFCLGAALHRRRRGHRTPPAIWLLLCAYGAAVLNSEAAFWVFADQPARLWGWIMLAAACLAAMIIVMRKKGRLEGIGAGIRRRIRIRVLLWLLTGAVLRLVFELTKAPLPHLCFALVLGLTSLRCASYIATWRVFPGKATS